jgi:flavin reductase (DIM6/NTAB) family NADH-FMN oxidoreductase RutF
MTPAHFTPVPLDKSWRLMNHGPTVLVSARHGGVTNVMAAAWACVLDYGQAPKVTVVLDKATFTRELIEASGFFALQLPTRAMATLTVGVGTDSARGPCPTSSPDTGCRSSRARTAICRWWKAAWAGWPAGCVPEPHNQQAYDLFIGEVVGAWADARVFRDGRWHFENAPDELRTIHHVAGGQFFVTGAAGAGLKGRLTRPQALFFHRVTSLFGLVPAWNGHKLL